MTTGNTRRGRHQPAMKRLSRLASGCLLTTIAALCLAQAPVGSDIFDFKSAEAKRAKAKYDFAMKQEADKRDRAIAEAVRAYESADDSARKMLLAELDAAMKEAAQRTQLDEAVKIRDAMKHLRETARAPTPSTPRDKPESPELQARQQLTSKLAGSVWTYAEGVRGGPGMAIRFNPDGTVSNKPGADWVWAPIDGHRVALRYPNGATDIFVFNDDVSEYKKVGPAGGTGATGWIGKPAKE